MKKINGQWSLTVAWLYPDLMNTYGDTGNIIVLKKRSAWRNIKVEIKELNEGSSPEMIEKCDLIFMGGAQDKQQEIVNKDLQGKKGKTLVSQIENGTPGLYICGAYQFLGKYYRTAENKMLPGLGVFPLFTEQGTQGSSRLIGNIAIKVSDERLRIKEEDHKSSTLLGGNHKPLTLVGFENHGGRTYLEDKKMALGNVIHGHGNNGKDNTEGIIYKNSIGTYLHGPILPKNPDLADYLISSALEKKYKKKIVLAPLDDTLEIKAHDFIVKKLGIKYN